MIRVCHMSSAHRGLDIRIYAKECVSLAEAGYEVHLVIAAASDAVEKAASQKVTLHALSPSTGRLTRMLKSAWRCYRIARGVDADIYHFHDPELIPYGILLRLSGKKVIYDVHEDLPNDILDKEWISPYLRRLIAGLMSMLEYIGARWFFNVIAATPFIGSRFRRITVNSTNINNYPFLDELAPPTMSLRCSDRICYVGGITRVRGLRPVIDALPKVGDVTLILCGIFSEPDFEEELRALPGWSRVDYRGQVGRAALQEIMSTCKAGIVTFLPIANHVDAQPNKMFEYMSAELPVIASDFPLWREIIYGAGAGLCVDPQSADAVAQAVRQILCDSLAVERMGKAGRSAILEKYNWPHEAAKLVAFYKEIK